MEKILIMPPSAEAAIAAGAFVAIGLAITSKQKSAQNLSFALHAAAHQNGYSVPILPSLSPSIVYAKDVGEEARNRQKTAQRFINEKWPRGNLPVSISQLIGKASTTKGDSLGRGKLQAWEEVLQAVIKHPVPVLLGAIGLSALYYIFMRTHSIAENPKTEVV